MEGEGDLEEVPRDGETREARAEDGVPQGTAAVLSCRRGRGSGCDGSPGAEGEAGKQTGRSRGRHGVRLSGHWAWNLKRMLLAAAGLLLLRREELCRSG